MGDKRGYLQVVTETGKLSRWTGTEQLRVEALAGVVKSVAGGDADRAADLLSKAESIAQSITSEDGKAKALAEFARAVAATDPDRAGSIARSITSETDKVQALVYVAEAVAPSDPDRATRLM